MRLGFVRLWLIIATCTLLGTLAGASIAKAQPQYGAIRILPDSGSVSMTAIRLNDRGQVLFTKSDGPLIWFKANDSLHKIAGFDTLGFSITTTGFNESGQVVGGFRTSNTSFNDRGFVANGSTVSQLRPENALWNESFWSSEASDVNASGVATGRSTTPHDDSVFGGAQIQCARWTGAGDAVGLGHLAGYRRSQGLAISSSRVIVGESSFPGPQGTFNTDPRACIWFGDAPVDLGALPGGLGHSSALDVNSSDWAVGWSKASDGSPDVNAALWPNPPTCRSQYITCWARG